MHIMSRRFLGLHDRDRAVASDRSSGRAFFFRSNAWLNLHHILWSSGQGASVPADMPEAERTAWATGIEFYAPYSNRNAAIGSTRVAERDGR
jgi:hypothetical protein